MHIGIEIVPNGYKQKYIASRVAAANFYAHMFDISIFICKY